MVPLTPEKAAKNLGFTGESGDWGVPGGFDSRPRYVSPAGLFGQRALPPQPVEIFRSSSARLTVNMSTSGENGFSRTVADSGRCICVTPSG